MLFGLHLMSHFTDVHNSFISYVHVCGWNDCWRNAISIRIPHPRETVATMARLSQLLAVLVVNVGSRCAVLQQVSVTGATSLNHSSRTSLAVSLIIVRMR